MEQCIIFVVGVTPRLWKSRLKEMVRGHLAHLPAS